MNKILPALVSIILFTTSTSGLAQVTDSVDPAANAKQPEIQTAQSIRYTDAQGKTAELRYLLFLPADYQPRKSDESDAGSNQKTSEKSWPMMIFLHGRGERGDDLQLVKKWGPPRIVETQPDFPFVLVSPQCPKEKMGWNTASLKTLLDHIIKSQNVDPDRVYLTGLSMGGYGAWALAAEYPKTFAAVVPICGGGDKTSASRLVDIPIWAFHGEVDDVVPVSQTRDMVQAIEQAGGKKIKMTLYPDVGHDSWRKAYADPELYKWLLQQKRSENDGR